jgi:hypothetical protein
MIVLLIGWSPGPSAYIGPFGGEWIDRPGTRTAKAAEGKAANRCGTEDQANLLVRLLAGRTRSENENLSRTANLLDREPQAIVNIWLHCG